MNAVEVEPKHQSTGQNTILVCLANEESRDFFPLPLQRGMERLFTNINYVDPSIGTEGLVSEINATESHVLLGGWRLPALPADRSEVPSLQYVCYLAGSVKRKTPKNLISQGVLVTNWGSSIASTVAECGLMLVLMCLREAGFWSLEMHTRGGFKTGDYAGSRSLFGRKVGIHGFGAVARALVKLLEPFHCTIHACSDGPPDEMFWNLKVHRTECLDDLFAHCDIVVETESLTALTREMVRERHLRMLGDGVFVNIARGEIVKEDDLIRVAGEGRLRIGLDVYHQEPLPPQHPLRGMSNVVLLPHIGGPTAERRQDAGKLALANLERFVFGKNLEALITEKIYDRLT